MIDPTTLIAYVLIVLGFVFIPGPATLLTIARATTSGTKAGIATGAGITVGDIIHTTMAVIGISAIIAASATLFTIIKYLGAGYLIYLGLKAIFERAPSNPSAGYTPVTPAEAFRQGVVAEVLNPKTALFFLAFLPQFVDPASGYVFVQLTVLGVIFALMGFISTLTFALAAGRLGSYLRRNPAVLRWQGKVAGGIYCALGARLALQER